MNEHMIVSEVARELSERNGVVIRPRDVSDLFYGRRLPDGRCRVLGGRRMIPRGLLDAIEEKLRERGVIPAPTGEVVR